MTSPSLTPEAAPTVKVGAVAGTPCPRRRTRRLRTLRLVREGPFPAPENYPAASVPIRTPRDVFDRMAPYAEREPVEVFWLLALDSQHRLIGGAPEAITRGILNSSLVHPREVFCAAFAPRTRSAKQLAAALGVHPSTLMSRFYRAGLPSPKTYVTYVRLVWAAHLGESPALSIGDIADRLQASSPQSFSRTVRSVLALTPGELRRGYDGGAMLERFRDQLIAPYRETLRTFDPLGDAGAQGDRAGQHGSEGSREGRAA